MKRFLYTLLFSTVFFFGMGMDSTISHAEETETKELIATSGQCGENVYWKIEGTTLIIYGTGDMYDYDGNLFNISGLPDYAKVRIVKEGGEHIEGGNDQIQQIIIEDGVTSVGDGAFYCVGTSVQIGKDVESIGYEAFYAFSGNQITIPGNVKEIGVNAFEDSHLRTVILENGVKTIRSGAFWRSSIEDVKWTDSIQIVESYAFNRTTWLKQQADENGFVIKNHMLLGYFGADREIMIPDGVTSIQGDGLGAEFYSEDEISKVNIPDSVTYIGEQTFSYLPISDIVLGDNLKYIGDYAFRGCKNLKNVTIPKNVTYIGVGAYQYLQSDQYVNRTYIVDKENTNYCVPEGCNVLYECKDNKIIAGAINSKIPEGTKAIEDVAFMYLPIDSLNLPKSLERIGKYSFSYCAIKQVVIPEMVQIIGEAAFANNTSLSDVQLLNEANIKKLDEDKVQVFSNCSNVKQFTCYRCNLGKSTKGHLYNDGSKLLYDNVIDANVDNTEFWENYYYPVCRMCSNAEQIHLYAQSKEEVLAGNTQKPELPDNGSETTRQDNTTTATEKTTEVPKSTEKTTEAVTGQTKNSPQITCSKLIKVKLKDLKKHSKKLFLKARTTSDGKLQYKITKYPKGAKKYISVNKKGMVTMKKGAKKGNYVVTITSPETKVYTKLSKNVTIRVK